MTLNRLRSLARTISRDPRLIGLGLYTYALLIVMRGVITLIPLRWITRYLGTPMQETPTDAVSAPQLREAHRISWMIEKLAPRTPTNSNCYPRALTARWLLHRMKIPSTVYYGAAFDPEGMWLEAHVWVRCGPLIVSGASAGLRFRPLSFFADVPASRTTLTA
jgi:hypothetical protein